MKWTRQSLTRVTHRGAVVYYVLQGELTEAAFRRLLKVFEAAGDQPITTHTWQEHWDMLRARAAGRSRWDDVAGPLSEKPSAEELDARAQYVHNVLRYRPYTAYRAEDVTYTIDLFNPANELEMSYAGAGETVVALMLAGDQPNVTQSELLPNQAFHRIVRGLAEVLDPEFICGAYSLYHVLRAYNEGKLDPATRPWDLSYQLMLLRKPARLVSPSSEHSPKTTNDSIALLWPMFQHPRFTELPLARLFKRVDVWDQERVLVQISDGFDALLDARYVEVARVLGKTAIQELVDL